MTETPVKDTANRDMAIRSTAMEWALKSGCGQMYDTEGRSLFNAEKIVKAAGLFELFIRGTK